MRTVLTIAIAFAVALSGTAIQAAGPDQKAEHKAEQKGDKTAEQKDAHVQHGTFNHLNLFHGKPDQVKGAKPDQVKLHHAKPDQVKVGLGLHDHLKRLTLPAHAQVSDKAG